MKLFQTKAEKLRHARKNALAAWEMACVMLSEAEEKKRTQLVHYWREQTKRCAAECLRVGA